MNFSISRPFPQFPFVVVGSVSAFLYLSGLGSILFLVPYAWLIVVYPPRKIALPVGVCGAIIGVTRLIQSMRIHVVAGELLVIGSLILILVLLVAPLHPRLRSLRGLYRALIVAGLFMSITLPVVYNTIQDPELLIMLSNVIKEVFQAQGVEFPSDNELYQLISNSLRVVCGLYVAMYLLIPIISWWIAQVGRLLFPRLFRNAVARSYPLEQFRLPRNSIVVVIALLAALLFLFILQSQSIVLYAVTNAVAVLVMLYIMQGAALIMRLCMLKRSRVRVTRGLLIIGVIVLFIPIVNAIVVAVVFMLGVSQTWVDYDRLCARGHDNK